MHGPLELLKEDWNGSDKQEVNVSQWVRQLQERLELIWDVVQEREAATKQTMNENMQNPENLQKIH